LQLLDDLVSGVLEQAGVVHRESWETDDGQKSAVDFFGTGFSREHRLKHRLQTKIRPRGRLNYLQDGLALLGLVRQHVYDAVGAPSRPEQIQLVHGLQRRLGHAYAAGVQLGKAVIGFVAPLPDPVIGGAIRALDVKNEVLYERDLVQVEDDLEPRRRHLRQNQQIQRDRVNLQVPPFVVPHNYLARLRRVLGVQRVQRVLRLLEPLHFVFLLHHGHQKTSHQFHARLFQLVRLGSVLVLVGHFFVRHRQPPHCEDAVHVVADPGVTVFRTCREQPSDGVLVRHDDPVHQSLVVVEAHPRVAPATHRGTFYHQICTALQRHLNVMLMSMLFL
jgi:hypothetical protein